MQCSAYHAAKTLQLHEQYFDIYKHITIQLRANYETSTVVLRIKIWQLHYFLQLQLRHNTLRYVNFFGPYHTCIAGVHNLDSNVQPVKCFSMLSEQLNQPYINLFNRNLFSFSILFYSKACLAWLPMGHKFFLAILCKQTAKL